MKKPVRKAVQALRLIVLLLSVTQVACHPEEVTQFQQTETDLQTARSLVPHCGVYEYTDPGHEGEIYGLFFRNGAIECNSDSLDFTVHLYDVASAWESSSEWNPLSNPFRDGLTANPSLYWHFEWWDPNHDGPCDGTDELENHSGDAGVEGHCVLAGNTYYYSDGYRDFLIDYLWSADVNTSGLPGVLEFKGSAPGVSRANQLDTKIYYDFLQGTGSDTPKLTVDVVTDRYSDSFTEATDTIFATADTWVRVSLDSSTVSWGGQGKVGTLARIHWGDDSTTNYYDPFWLGVLRMHRYNNVDSVFHLGAELMRPDEQPADSSGGKRTVVVTRIRPDVAFLGSGSAETGSGYTVPPGGNIQLTFTVKNLTASPGGFGVANSGWYTKFYLSTDTVLSPSTDVLILSAIRSSTLGPEGTFEINAAGFVPSTLANGDYYLIGVLDPSATLGESNTANNQVLFGHRITVDDTALPVFSSFGVASCSRYPSGGKWRTDWTFNWTLIDDEDFGWSWEIIESPSTPDYPALVGSGSTGRGGVVGPYNEVDYPYDVNFFIRYTNGVNFTDWTGLTENTLEASTCPASQLGGARLLFPKVW